MTSKIWVEGCKYSAIVGTIFGLLLPGLPLLAAPSAIGENLSSTSSGNLLIAQATSLCVGNDKIYEHFSTATYEISICQDEYEVNYLVYVNKKSSDDSNVLIGVTMGDGTYRAKEVTVNGTTFLYSVGSSFQVTTEDGEMVVSEKTF
ncbi:MULTISPECIES: hypothetical protein [unclassified Microcoleus]|uniref:hypothetical protein n=1 Tax=unclassified Microcoleus TaxID=2642155 RepID=UPI002FD476C6